MQKMVIYCKIVINLREITPFKYFEEQNVVC